MKTHVKKSLVLILALLMMLGCFNMGAYAADSNSARASNYFLSYDAQLSAAGNGKLRISGTVDALSIMSSIGIAYFRVYLADGTFVTTVPGSTTNGLLVSNSDTYSGSFTYQAVSGNRYYVVVTFICRNASGYEYKNYRTNTVTA